ncbi:hypothetical protein GOBAR_AA35441 [Gossypium barbadense]|uniref:Uncharacterized protein n=1 Tax=Gossypium barbadense TaxID=3634 RepID=A0A2P5W2D9_GOSBA|nr:hypothetical protein GOBAR_AA35441 [Gossypium barbadense]
MKLEVVHGRGNTPVFPNFSARDSRILNLGASDNFPTPVYLGRVGSHDHVARSCLALFTSLTPVSRHGRVARSCYFGKFAHGHVAC